MSRHIETIEKVEEEFAKFLLLADEGIVRLTCAVAIANRIGTDPVWLLILGPSSGGKTEIIRSLDKLPFIHPIDLLTTNTFASGMMKNRTETSLLNKVNGGILTFKDFTTLLSMNKEGLNDIMGQLRSIYDGTFSKRFGTGEEVNWVGKIGVIAAGTGECQRVMRQYSKNGERFINYTMRQPDRKGAMRMAAKNQKDIKAKRDAVQDMVQDFIEGMCNKLVENQSYVTEEVQGEMFDIADFSCLARSPVILNFKTNAVEFVPEPEMPMRVSTQLINIANVFMGMNNGVLSDKDRKILYKIALDSIPVHRRMVLSILTKYEYVTTKAIALKLNYPTETVKIWLTEIDALKLCDRKEKMEGNADGWTLKKEWRQLLGKFDGIEVLDTELTETELNEEMIKDLDVDGKLMDSTMKELKGHETWDGLTELLPPGSEEQLDLGLDE